MYKISEASCCRLWLGGVVLFLTLTYLLRPIGDPDFFWHLHHGQWLWEHGALPSTDPFALSAPAEITPRQHYILTSYWLAQWFYFGVYKFSGWVGFFPLRVFLLLGMIWALSARFGKLTISNTLLISSLVLVIFARFPVERPQFLSFVAFALLLALLDRLRQRSLPDRLTAVSLPLLLLIWANLHGGVLLGQILCLFYLGLAGMDAVRGGKVAPRQISVLVVALFLSLCSPSGINHLSVMIEAAGGQYRNLYAGIAEYDHIGIAIFKRKAWVYLLFPGLALPAFYGLIKSGIRQNFPHILLLLAFTLAACGSVRYLPFLGILALVPAADAMAPIARRWMLPAPILVFILCAVASPGNFANMARLRDVGPVSASYPAGAVAYIRQQGLHGQVLNNFVWGGYLRFMLGPGHEMLVDGRTLDISRFRDYNQLLSFGGGFENVRAFREILDKYRFDYVILPKAYNGQPLWMNWVLSQLPGWRLGYDDGLAVVCYRLP